jgi:predicted flap endonuclease-1-like 5' DNA nuclease
MQGVGYATIEIIGLILLGALIGFLLGWILRRFLYDTDVSEYEARLESAHTRRKTAELELATTRDRLDEATQVVASTQAQIAEAEARSGAIAAEAEAARTLAREKDGRIEELESESIGLRAETSDAIEAANAAGGRLEGLESEIAGLRADLDAALVAAGEKEATIARLEAEIAGFGDVRAESDARADRIAELEILVVEREKLVDPVEAAELEAQLVAAHEELSALHAQVDQLSAAAEAVAVASDRARHSGAVPLAVVPDDEPPAPEGNGSPVDLVALRTAGGESVPDDDLKRIRGVGPKLESMLKAMGITSFRQIARFDASDIAVVSEALNGFPGRIERDDWMASAAELHEATYGEPA